MPLVRARDQPMGFADGLMDHLHDDHGVSMIRSLRAAQGRVLMTILDGGPMDPITIEAETTCECLERLHARLTAEQVTRSTMNTIDDRWGKE